MDRLAALFGLVGVHRGVITGIGLMIAIGAMVWALVVQDRGWKESRRRQARLGPPHRRPDHK